MIVKRKLYSVMDEEGNLGYYLYNESTGEEKLFSVVEDEKMYARGVGSAVTAAKQMASSKGMGVANKVAKNAQGLRNAPWYTTSSDLKKQLSAGRKEFLTRKDYKNVPQLHHNINMRSELVKDGIYKNGFKVPQSYAEAAIGVDKRPLSMVRDVTANFLRR